jgi:hypothetical protein
MPTTQALTALEHANRIRTAMADVKRDVRSRGGRHRAARYLQDPSEGLARMELGTFLRSIHRFGPRTIPPLLHEAGLPMSSMTWRVGPAYETWEITNNARALTTRQRLALAAALAKPSHHKASV